MIKAVLFDLDGTLLPMDQDVFVKAYFTGLAKKLAPRGYDSKELVATIWAGTTAMVKNNGEKKNEDVFWDSFSSHYGEKYKADLDLFDDFYRNEFQDVQKVCGFAKESAEIVHALSEKGITVVLATNPLFPTVATESRIRWAGLEPENFALVTTFENTGYCKPNLDYYRDILSRLGLKAEECLMVGNDVSEDMIAENLGMKVFLLVDCLINKDGEDIERYPHGSFRELREFLASEEF